MNKIGKRLQILLMVALTVLCCSAVQAKTAKITIKDVQALDATTVAFETNLSGIEGKNAAAGNQIKIYRTSKKGGKWKLLDSFTAKEGSFGNWRENSGAFFLEGEKGVVSCVSAVQGFDGKCIFYDTTAKIWQTYYYKISLYSKAKDKNIAGSAIVHAKAKLAKPTITMTNTDPASGSATLGWSGVKGASGYEVYKKGNGSWTLQGVVTSQEIYTQSGLSAGNHYYRVRAFLKRNGKTYYSSYSKKVKIGITKMTEVPGDYNPGESSYGENLSAAQLEEVRAAVGKFLQQNINSSMSVTMKLRTAMRYLYNRRGSGREPNLAFTAWGALLDYTDDCWGLSRAYKAICDAMGIECITVLSTMDNQHMWNMVRLNGVWYIVDVQLGDSAFLLGSRSFKEMGMTWNESAFPTASTNDYSEG